MSKARATRLVKLLCPEYGRVYGNKCTTFNVGQFGVQALGTPPPEPGPNENLGVAHAPTAKEAWEKLCVLLEEKLREKNVARG